ncbi:hypothetical protein [Rhodobacter sp. SY28-1]|uniref:hypothetical protein n=1 Tax=Rhodobacter sp. SY28-1 TaxID=2562317 RepID=UPI0010C00770|nr:hypothetical protein [Rhodobacter sp. SY28-1]
MTDTSTQSPAPIRTDLVIVGLVAGLVLAGLLYLLSQAQQELRRSPVGFDGLQVWLASEGGSAQNFTGGWLLDPASIGLLVLPVFDTVPGRDLEPALDKLQLLYQQDESDLDWRPLREKIETLPGLIVLPKWRSGMRLTGIAHPALLVEEARLNALLRSLTGEKTIRLSRVRRVFTSLPYRSQSGVGMEAELYAAQLFDGSACAPIIGQGAETLLASCPVAGSNGTVLILSDPDLLNNHGLRLGDNAQIARDFLLSAAGDGSLVIDYSRDNWLASTEEPIQRERTWADLLRFFQPPFLALWLGGGITLALVLWRSFRRAGPVLRTKVADSGKLLAIRARARLMRLTGQDGALLADYAAARVAATAARLVGPGHARQIGEERAFLRYLARRRPDLAARLEEVIGRVKALPARIPATVAIQHVEDLEQILELIANDP